MWRFGGAATWTAPSPSTHSPSLSACVTQETTTPARAAATSSGSASGSATQPLRGRISSRVETACSIARRGTPAARSVATLTTPPPVATASLTNPIPADFRVARTATGAPA